jgi:hypothetical protein
MTSPKTLSLLLTTLLAAAIPGTRAGAQSFSCSVEPAPESVADAGCGESAPTAPARPATLTRGRLFHQIRYHLALPSSRPRILDSLSHTAELTEAETAWIASALPRRTFTSGAQVLLALFPDTPADVLARVDLPVVVVSR